MSDKKNILQKIVENKKQELQGELYWKYKIESPGGENKKSNWEKFKKIFKEKNANIIWEIKIASPKFDYSDEINLEKVFEFYWKNNEIKAISNLIDEKYFSGDINRWKIFKQKYDKPIFFKEFVVSKTQIDWANYFGYDALLLLARVLDEEKLIEFIDYTNSKNIFPIVEVDCEEDMGRVLNIWRQNNNSPIIPFHKGDENNNYDFWIAINCRNLWNMEIDRKKHFSIIKNFENKLKNKIIFAFSWIDNLEQVKEYKWIFNGVLVGSYFMERIKEDL